MGSWPPAPRPRPGRAGRLRAAGPTGWHRGRSRRTPPTGPGWPGGRRRQQVQVQDGKLGPRWIEELSRDVGGVVGDARAGRPLRDAPQVIRHGVPVVRLRRERHDAGRHQDRSDACKRREERKVQPAGRGSAKVRSERRPGTAGLLAGAGGEARGPGEEARQPLSEYEPSSAPRARVSQPEEPRGSTARPSSAHPAASQSKRSLPRGSTTRSAASQPRPRPAPRLAPVPGVRARPLASPDAARRGRAATPRRSSERGRGHTHRDLPHPEAPGPPRVDARPGERRLQAAGGGSGAGTRRPRAPRTRR